MVQKINHWTREQEARSLELWSDRHPLISGAVTVLVLPIYALMIAGGIMAMLLLNLWTCFPDWLKNVCIFTFGFLAVIAGLYLALYAGLWTCGKLLAH